MSTILGTNGDDVLNGTRDTDEILGGGGDDQISGKAGDDIIFGGSRVEPASTGNAVVSDSSTAVITFESEEAGYKSAIGVYKIAEDGLIYDVEIVFSNASAQRSGGSLKPGQSEFEYGTVRGVQLGFFIIPDAWSISANRHLLQSNVSVFEFRNSNGEQARVTDGPATLVRIDRETGEETVVRSKYGTDVYHSIGNDDTGYRLNNDGVQHAVVTPGDSGEEIQIAFEDLRNGGDKDFNDVVISVAVPPAAAPQSHNDQPSAYGDDDTIKAGAGNDTVYGGKGDDIVNGGTGDDIIQGNSGDDDLSGDDGADEISGGTGDDEIAGGDGNDEIAGGKDDDVIRGGRGDDTILADSGDDHAYGDDGDDVLYGGTGNDELYGGDDNDTVRGGKDDDTVGGGAGNDILYGDSGDDFVSGNEGNDTLKGGDGDDELIGGEGSDKLYGGKNDDILEGGAGNDRVKGDSGDDLIRAGEGDDWIDGGSGFDTADYSASNSGIDANLQTGRVSGFGSDQIKGIEKIIGTRKADSFTGDHRDNEFVGGEGDDLFQGGRGDDIFEGGAGSDTFVWSQQDIVSHAGTQFHVDSIADFSGEDVLDLRNAANISEGQDIADVVALTEDNGNTTVSVLYQGTGAWHDVVVLEGVTNLSLTDLQDNGQILV